MAPACGVSITTTSLRSSDRAHESRSRVERGEGRHDFAQVFGTRLHQDAGDLAARRRDELFGIDDAASDERTAIGCRVRTLS